MLVEDVFIVSFCCSDHIEKSFSNPNIIGCQFIFFFEARF